ncbi:hypothetical protein [Brevibacillus sp. 179-C9.3 HS]|uniref:hypothetical protein n=1 Tax=unclassified Brevibacillus TaxID=2684853 RepID=UPI0039A1DFBA
MNLYKQLEQVLLEMELNDFKVLEEKAGFSLLVKLNDSKAFRVYLFVHEKLKVILITVPSIIKIPEETTDEAVKYIMDLNSNILYGTTFIHKNDETATPRIAFSHAISMERGETGVLYKEEIIELLHFIAFIHSKINEEFIIEP